MEPAERERAEVDVPDAIVDCFQAHILSGDALLGWQGLLEEATEALADAPRVKADPEQARASFPLEDCAQMVELAFLRERRDFRQTLAGIIASKPVDP